MVCRTHKLLQRVVIKAFFFSCQLYISPLLLIWLNVNFSDSIQNRCGKYEITKKDCGYFTSSLQLFLQCKKIFLCKELYISNTRQTEELELKLLLPFRALGFSLSLNCLGGRMMMWWFKKLLYRWLAGS